MKLVPVCYVTIDGKEYGPFTSEQEDEVRKLLRVNGAFSRRCAIDGKHIPAKPDKKPKVHHDLLF